ncbi:hypothetical protein CNR22_00070 [Sphingobacteriaceae bacterium]|nr:hypothetical protein CNR22_00070 [Sphingobacteriaceae bacterium]
MEMPGRRYQAAGSYRYGFNGKENDNEVKGSGIQQDYGLRIYDTRIARFLSVDPLTAGYPSWSPFPFAMNRPIDGIDLDGGEWKPVKDEGGNIQDYTWDGYDENGKAREGTVANATLKKDDLTLRFASNAEKQMGHVYIEGKTEYTNFIFGNVDNNFLVSTNINQHIVFSSDNAVWGPAGCPSCDISSMSGDYSGASGAEIASLAMPKTVFKATGRLEDWYPETFFIPVERIFFIGAKILTKPVIGSLGAAAKGLAKSQKFIFPSWKKVKIDMKEVSSGHMTGGSRIAENSKKDIFPTMMNENQVKTAIFQAYNNIHTIVKKQGEKYLIQGTTKTGMEIEMWFNKTTKEIETAYPQY